jgi:hypothetical protein
MSLAVTAAFAGCSNAPGTLGTVPSAVPSAASSSLSAQGGTPTVRFYHADIAPATAAANSAVAVSVTIYNCAAATAGCAGQATTSTQHMKSATVAVPAGFTVTSSLVATVSGGKTWTANLVAGTIQLVSVSGDNNALLQGEWVKVAFTATAASTCGAYAFTSVGYNGSDFATPYTIVGDQPSIAVTGCGSVCTLSQGYWKTHEDAWPVSTLTLGSVSYTQAQLLSILHQPVGGNGLVSLAYQLIAAKLNKAAGADTSALGTAIADADALIGSLTVPPVGTDWVAPSTTGALTTALDQFNTGVVGPGHCSSDSSAD